MEGVDCKADSRLPLVELLLFGLTIFSKLTLFSWLSSFLDKIFLVEHIFILFDSIQNTSSIIKFET